ncbi:hypothetical protein [Roseinatronobacter bogoriensis]|nr:hypothetical protein [Rhodobaca barguzinensis]
MSAPFTWTGARLACTRHRVKPASRQMRPKDKAARALAQLTNL